MTRQSLRTQQHRPTTKHARSTPAPSPEMLCQTSRSRWKLTSREICTNTPGESWYPPHHQPRPEMQTHLCVMKIPCRSSGIGLASPCHMIQRKGRRKKTEPDRTRNQSQTPPSRSIAFILNIKALQNTPCPPNPRKKLPMYPETMHSHRSNTAQRDSGIPPKGKGEKKNHFYMSLLFLVGSRRPMI